MATTNAFCPHCGSGTQDGWVHCPSCGGQLTSGDDVAEWSAPRRRTRKWFILSAVLVALVAVACGLWVGNQALYAKAYGSWFTSTEAAEDTMETYLAAEKKAQDEWNRATSNGANNSQGAFDTWQEAVSNAAYTGVADLKVQQHDMEQMTFLPWQGAIATARDDYVDHMQAWIDLTGAVSQLNADGDYDAAWKRHGPDIQATFDIATRSAKDALPRMFQGDLPKRVDAEFAS